LRRGVLLLAGILRAAGAPPQVHAIGGDAADEEHEEDHHGGAARLLHGGLRFGEGSNANADWSLTQTGNTDFVTFVSTLTYALAVDASFGTYTITGATLNFANLTMAGSFTGAGAGVTVTEEVCLGVAVFASNCANKVTLTLGSPFTATATNQVATASFAGQTVVAVRDTVSANFGTTNGARSFSLPSLENHFDQTGTAVPEPGTFAMLGFALCAVATVTKRRRK